MADRETEAVREPGRDRLQCCLGPRPVSPGSLLQLTLLTCLSLTLPSGPSVQMSFFLHLPVSPSLLLPVPVCPCLSICLPTSPLSVCLSADLSLLCQPDSPFLTHLSIRLYVFPFQSVYVTLSPSLCLPLLPQIPSLSVCLPVCLCPTCLLVSPILFLCVSCLPVLLGVCLSPPHTLGLFNLLGRPRWRR